LTGGSQGSGQKVGDGRDQAAFVELEEADAGHVLAVEREVDPAHALPIRRHDAVDGQVPLSRELGVHHARTLTPTPDDPAGSRRDRHLGSVLPGKGYLPWLVIC
jgi:hypothetical protein